MVADSALCPLAAAPDPPFARGRFADSVQRAAEELADSNVRRLKQLRTRLDAGLEERLCQAPFPASTAEPLRWVHFPKAGTTFANTLFRHGCPALKARSDMTLGNLLPEDQWYALDAQTLARAKRGRADYNPVVVGTQHLSRFVARACPRNHSFASTHTPLSELELERWAEHSYLWPNERTGVAAVFRAPLQRAISAYHFGKHIWPCGERCAQWRDALQRNKSLTMGDFVAAPGISAVYARMLNGCCSAVPPVALRDGHAVIKCDGACIGCRAKTVGGGARGKAHGGGVGCTALDEEFAEQAARRVRGMAFVGILEVYRASVCLFHRRFGGELLADELAKFNVGSAHKLASGEKAVAKPYALAASKKLTSASLKYGVDRRWARAHVDPVDERVFAAALDAFDAQLTRWAS